MAQSAEHRAPAFATSFAKATDAKATEVKKASAGRQGAEQERSKK